MNKVVEEIKQISKDLKENSKAIELKLTEIKDTKTIIENRQTQRNLLTRKNLFIKAFSKKWKTAINRVIEDIDEADDLLETANAELLELRTNQIKLINKLIRNADNL